MPFTIGLRFYKIAIREKGASSNVVIGPKSAPCDMLKFIERFVQERAVSTTEDGEQRSWALVDKKSSSIRTSDGIVEYGTHGFESSFKDVKTRSPRFSRKSTDLEEVPLYYQFWSPEGAEFALAAFQSFQGRSCITNIRRAFIDSFKAAYPNYLIFFNVLAPSAAMLDQAPVKTVTFYKPMEAPDRSERYLLGKRRDEIQYEVTVRARRRGDYFSTYKDLRERFKEGDDGTVEFDGSKFQNVKADIAFGGRRRTVGVYGAGYDAGLIDVTEEVDTTQNGHPTLKSIRVQVDELMETFYDSLVSEP